MCGVYLFYPGNRSVLVKPVLMLCWAPCRAHARRRNGGIGAWGVVYVASLKRTTDLLQGRVYRGS